MTSWLVIGISGVTCGGKTTLAHKILSLFPSSRYLNMDHFFLPSDDPRHKKAPGLNHNNWELVTAIDVEKWKNAINNILHSNPNDIPQDEQMFANFDIPKDSDFQPSKPVSILKHSLLVLDGFVALNDPWTVSQCHLKFYLTLTKEQCWERRQNRHYDPADIPGYFDACVWPEHIAQKADVVAKNQDLILLDGSKKHSENLNLMLEAIYKCDAKLE